MRICVVGAGAVGGLVGVKLARSGHEVIVIARGAHLHAIRSRGLALRTPQGEVRAEMQAEERPERVGPVDVVIYAVKTYSNPETLPLLRVAAGEHAVVLTLQNGVDSPSEVESVVGRGRVLGGAAYVATAIAEAGVIQQTGLHRRIVFGETRGDLTRVSGRVAMMDTIFGEADLVSEPVPNAWVPLWEKYTYLAPFAAFTGAARQPIGPLWSDAGTRKAMTAAFREVEAVAAAERITLPKGAVKRITAYVDSLEPTVRSSFLIDLQQHKPTEVEALLGGVVRRGKRRGVPTPIMSTLYAVMKSHARPTAATT